MPSSRVDYWREKIRRNQERDERNIQTLSQQGWRVLVVWECAIPKRQPDDERQQVIDSIERWLSRRAQPDPD